MIRNLINYIYSKFSEPVHEILRGMLDQLRERQIGGFACLRETITWEMPQSWRQIKPADLEVLVKEFELADQLLVLELASFHQSGYVRQKAVELLNRIHQGTELRCLLIRLNDWVDNVASAASLAVTARLSETYRAAFVSELPFVLHLFETGRRNNLAMLQRILELLTSHDPQKLLATIQNNHSEAVLRSFFKLCLRLEIDSVKNLVKAGLAANDPYLRGCAMNFVARKLPLEEQLGIAAAFYGDRSVTVRRIALSIAVQDGGKSALAELRRALFDHSHSVRDIAQFYLRKQQQDVAEVYRQELLINPESLIALQGLSETGGDVDEVCFLTYARHTLPSRRHAALRGLSHLHGEKVDAVILAMLLDSKPRIARLSGRILHDQDRRVSGQQLFDLYLASQGGISQQRILHLFEKLGKWQHVLWTMRLLPSLKKPESEEIINKLKQWFSPPRSSFVFSAPFANEIDDLRSAYQQIAGFLPAAVRQTLKEAIG